MTAGSETSALPDGVFSEGEHLWRAKPGATSTFEESVDARELWLDIHRDRFWNPWRFEEQAAEVKHAEQVMWEWERAEPGFRQKTKRQVDAEMRRWERQAEERKATRERERLANLERYDEARAAARLELLEHQCILHHKQTEVADFRSGNSLPGHGPKRRAERIATLGEEIAGHKAAIDRLAPIVGDPEDVPDEHGLLPRDRRLRAHYVYRERRIAEVRDLRNKLAELDGQINDTTDRHERSKLRADRDTKQRRLRELLAVPRQEVEDMCADCALPAQHHGYVIPPYEWPCPAWPGQRAILERVRQLLESASRRRVAEEESPTPPKPEPLAIVPSGLSVAEVVQRLQELQTKFPEAVVHRGRANRWELWPESK